MSIKQRAGTIGTAVLLTLTFTWTSPAHAAVTKRCSPKYGDAAANACVSRDTALTSGPNATPFHILESTNNVSFYNATVTAEQCDGTGNNCGFTRQEYFSSPSTHVSFLTNYSFGHTYRTRASWSDVGTGARWTNAVSPLVA